MWKFPEKTWKNQKIQGKNRKFPEKMVKFPEKHEKTGNFPKNGQISGKNFLTLFA